MAFRKGVALVADVPDIFIYDDNEAGIQIQFHVPTKLWFLQTEYGFNQIKPRMAAAIIRGMSERGKS